METTPTYYTGIDLHKRTAYLTTIGEDGAVAGQKKLPCRRRALRQYFASFEAGSSHQAAVELHPHLVPDEQVQRLLWIPGVGKTVAFTIRLEVGSIDRF